ncbi:MAG: rfaE bifunctional protein kinase chain/domain [Candidatus Omnitrophota bacterium]|jgi:rfaE bifunctional protein kinase chain/domain
MEFKSIIRKFGSKNILVVGDVILDKYIQGSVSRISPEAPVPIVLEETCYSVPGGAANVAHNLAALGVNVSLAGRVGDDAEGALIKKELKKKGINTRAIFLDKNFPTILKTRVIAQNQQVVRIDREKADLTGSASVFKKLKTFIKNNINSYDAIIISDYGKGLITPDLIDFLSMMAKVQNKIITVDPKVGHFSYYTHVTAITPNLKEAENAIRNIKVTNTSDKNLKVHVENLRTEKDIELAGRELLKYLDLECLLITLGENGMRLFARGEKTHAIKTKAIEVFDVSGAGDAVISVFTLALAVGVAKKKAAELANIAAGIVVGKSGTAAVTKKELLAAV